MSIVQLPTALAAETGIIPATKKMVVTDSLATLTTAGYLNTKNLQGYEVNASDILEIEYLWSEDTQTGTFGFFTVSISSTGIITLTEHQAASGVNATLPTTANEVAVFSNTSGDIKSGASIASNLDGSFQAGTSGTAGQFVSFPSTAARGSLAFAATPNTGNTATTVTNEAMGQASIVSIPDPGAATANFIMSNTTDAQQTILRGDLQLVDGYFYAGDTTAGNVGGFFSYPPDANSGWIQIDASNSPTNAQCRITNMPLGQSTVFFIPDPASGIGYFLVSEVPTDPAANLVTFDITAPFSALAAGAEVVLYVSNNVQEYKVRNLYFAGGSLSGGGGDRDVIITDNTTVYSTISAANVQTTNNGIWGDAVLPLPSPGVALNIDTVGGADLVMKYAGGAADYTAGSITIGGILERVV